MSQGREVNDLEKGQALRGKGPVRKPQLGIGKGL